MDDLKTDQLHPTSIFGEMDQYLFAKGVHYDLHRRMGARFVEGGATFVLYAPHAKSVSVVGDFNDWKEDAHPMTFIPSSGVWCCFIPGAISLQKYQFQILNKDGVKISKSDPYALYSELRPNNASVLWDIDAFEWKDNVWMEERKEKTFWNSPMNIYEVHLGSWKRGPEGFMNYKEIAKELAIYCNEMGYTHIELMPLTEHPLDESWGYQVTGFFSVTSRYGTPSDFQFFVDHMHEKGIGVILDWVPAHFPTDTFALAQLDGSYLYEHADPKQGFHPHWNTLIFNYGKNEVTNFLLASALFWLDCMHIDGLRVDAVASMLYLDYGRKEGEWIPNKYGGRENLEAIDFIKHLNSTIHTRFPGALMIAEESTSFFGVTTSVASGGLGFDLKWNLGWMNDSLKYMQKEPEYRKFEHEAFTHTFVYAFNERFLQVLSHDEVVHEKKSLLSKMPGDEWQRMASLRLYLGYMICHPGKKLLFMGGEFGQIAEWYEKESIHWDLLRIEAHQGLYLCAKELNHFYLRSNALWEKDFDESGFEWVEDAFPIIAFLRKSSSGNALLCICNFAKDPLHGYKIPLENASTVREVFNTDRQDFGGSGILNHFAFEGECVIPPLATVIFEVTFD